MTTPKRFDLLSTSDSGLHFVREKKGGVMRMLTESELEDFNDPPPCPQCAEQFGCEHRNYAGEATLTDAEVDALVPPQWLTLARTHGLSRADVARLQSMKLVEGDYQAAPGADLRTLELMVLLNEER